jgi:hypothetical protein
VNRAPEGIPELACIPEPIPGVDGERALKHPFNVVARGVPERSKCRATCRVCRLHEEVRVVLPVVRTSPQHHLDEN